MGDYDRYRGMSHEQLFEQLKVGQPNQVESLAADWSAMQRTLDGLVARLDEDVRGLLRNWDGPAGREFEHRLGLVSLFTREITGDMTSVQEGLHLMSGPLRTALSNAESPEETDDHDKAAKGAGIGGLIAGPPGALAGGLLGNMMDDDEKDKARQRMVETVTTLAAAYDVAGHSRWPTEAVPPSPEMPGSTSGLGAGSKSGSPVHATSAGPATGPGGTDASRTADDPTIPSQPGTLGESGLPNQVIDGGDPGDGDGSILLGAAAAAAAVGLTGAVRGSVLPSATGGAKTPSASLLSSQSGGGVRGVLGREALSPNESAATGGRGVGRNVPGVGPGGEEHSSANAGKSAVGGRTASDDEDEGDEHLTWLTEDEMVWGTDTAPPPVLGPPSA